MFLAIFFKQSKWVILQLPLKKYLHLEVVLQGTEANEGTGSQFWRGQTRSSELLEMGTALALTINKLSPIHLS